MELKSNATMVIGVSSQPYPHDAWPGEHSESVGFCNNGFVYCALRDRTLVFHHTEEEEDPADEGTMGKTRRNDSIFSRHCKNKLEVQSLWAAAPNFRPESSSPPMLKKIPWTASAGP